MFLQRTLIQELRVCRKQDCSAYDLAHAEADAFFCFKNLMGEVMDNFIGTLDASDVGVNQWIARLNFLLHVKDPVLWSDLEKKHVDPNFYSFRWITLLLSQEFTLPDVLQVHDFFKTFAQVLRLWDSLFSDENRFNFLFCFCCSMLICVRDTIINSDFSETISLLQV